MMQAVSTRAMPSDTLHTTAKGAVGGVTLSYGEETYGGGDISRGPPSNVLTMVVAFGGWIDAGGGGDRCAALPGPPARGHTARVD